MEVCLRIRLDTQFGIGSSRGVLMPKRHREDVDLVQYQSEAPRDVAQLSRVSSVVRVTKSEPSFLR